ncbi:MAG: ABC transporter ATP-binding protein [Verrucomicrobiota bacterium]
MPKTLQQIAFIHRLCWPYMRLYWKRFFLGIAFCILFGLSHGLFVGAAKIIAEQINTTPSAITEININADQITNVFSFIESKIDPLLPSLQEPLTPLRIVFGILFIFFLAVLRGVLGYISKYLIGWANERFMRDLRCKILDKLMSLSLNYFNANSSGDLHSSINRDTDQLHRAYQLGLSDLIREPFVLIGVAVGLAMINWKLALFSFTFLPLCAIPIIILGKKVKKAATKKRVTDVSQSSLILQALSNVRVIKSFGLEKVQALEFLQLSNQLVSHNMRIIRSRSLTNPIIESIAALAFGFTLIFAIYFEFRLPDIAGFLMAVIFSYSPIKKLAGLNLLIQQSYVSVERIQKLLLEEPNIKEAEDAIELKTFNHLLSLQSISFSYPESEENALNNISIEVPKGHRIGIVGESGSGKSTLINLILRFYDVHQGSINIDGHNIRNLSLKSLLNQFSFVGQEVLLFNKSVYENISYGTLETTEDDIIRAAKAAHADSFIRELPEGYQTTVGEYGFRLSGGQRQRIALARALVRKAPIILLDEATSALDSASESEIQRAIDNLPENKTIISVAHRLSTLRQTDCIYVLAKGNVVQCGHFKDLLSVEGNFKSLAEKQGMTHAHPHYQT